jgi:hypothetical protein
VTPLRGSDYDGICTVFIVVDLHLYSQNYGVSVGNLYGVEILGHLPFITTGCQELKYCLDSIQDYQVEYLLLLSVSRS